MTDRIQSIRGMPDILPAEVKIWQRIESTWRDLVQAYGYDEIRFPLLEKTGLFKRSIGEVTDIVEKEMFTFLDRDKESITLRPEGTAGCVRAGLEHGILYNQIQRLWYMGPMFRYEKPQKGRYRQFNQLGIEAFGLEGPAIEVEQILMMDRFFKKLIIQPDWVKLQINSLGSISSRERYRTELVVYFKKHFDQLDEDSQRRLATNPLRILDSKNPDLSDILQAAPKALDYLTDSDKQHHETLMDYLSTLGVAFTVNPCLVRGLDYYNRTVYEWTTDKLGAQGTICAGGRYDGLVEQLGGKATPAVGFAIGMERLVLLIQAQTVALSHSIGQFYKGVFDVYFICLGEAAQKKALALAEQFRDSFATLRITVHCAGGNFKQQFKRADKMGAQIAFILAEHELMTDTLSIKFLREEDKEQLSLPVKDVASFLENHFALKRGDK